MRITKLLVASLLLGLTTQSMASADWDEFWHEVDVHRKRVAYWPEPFLLPDRELVRQPFRIMVDNGWRMQTTLIDPMFHKETNQLTSAGKSHVRWILTQTPPNRRHIYVLEGITPEHTAERMQSVYNYLAMAAPGMPTTCVSPSQVGPDQTPGYYLDAIQNAYRAGIPSPHLSAPAASGGAPAAGANLGGSR